MSNFPGKIAVFNIGVIILFAVINNSFLLKLNYYLYFVSLILIFYSSYLYFIRFKKSLDYNNEL